MIPAGRRQRWSRLNLPRRGLVMATVGVVVVGYAIMTMFLNFMRGFPSNLVRQQIAAIRQELPALPRGSSLYLLNLWPPAFGMEFMLPLRRTETGACYRRNRLFAAISSFFHVGSEILPEKTSNSWRSIFFSSPR
ncbi:MAG: hypothetical protein WCV00_21925 [Verrucomicrobiia bacterium]|jgi:hypothetical protein